MSGELEAAGAAITAGLAAGEVDARDAHKTGGRFCANCGAALHGKYCSACGQAGHVHRTLGHVFEELVHGILHFDGRAWRTLPMLAFRPGTLTGDYIFGMRQRFVSPIALFLFVVFAMFFVFSLLGGVGSSPQAPPTTAQLQQDVAAAKMRLQTAEAALARTSSGGAGSVIEPRLEDTVSEARDDVQAAEATLAARMQTIDAFQKARAQLERNELVERAKPPSEGRDDTLAEIETGKRLIDEALANPSGPPPGWHAAVRDDGEVAINLSVSDAGGMESLFEQVKAANARGDVVVNTGVPDWDKKIRAKLDNPELAWYKIQNAAYKFAFLLVPLSLPFVAFLFLFKKNVTLYDHAVFVLYSLSFVCILAMTAAIVARIAPDAAGPVAGTMAVALPVHMFFQLKGGYGLSWWSALWRTLVLCVFAVLCLSVFIVAIILLGLVG